MRSIPLALIVCSLLVACTEERESMAPAVLAVVGEPASVGEAPRGIYLLQDEPVTDIQAAPMHRIVYLNFDGGTFTPGSNNSSSNRSSIVNNTSSVSPWGSASARQAVTACVQELFSPFNVTITTTDPGDVQHIEAVTAGWPQDIGMPNGVGGVSPYNCGIIERSIVFSFAEVYGSSYRSLCETVAQEVAHSFGLDHQLLCEDPMTYLSGCGAKSFQDVDSQCGEDRPRACQCGGSTQNSVQMLLDALGPSGPGVPPELAITEPLDGATVAPGFVVRATATDDVRVESVELYIDGSLVQTLITAPYVFNAPASISAGNHTVEVRAYDASNITTRTIDVSVSSGGGGGGGGGDECGASNPCPDGSTCQAGVCVPDAPADGDTGAPCDSGADCASGLCLSDGEHDRCSEICDPGDAASCPAGFDCVSSNGADSVCWPSDGGEPGSDLAGGCAVGARSGGAASGAWLLALALLRVRRRRHAR